MAQIRTCFQWRTVALPRHTPSSYCSTLLVERGCWWGDDGGETRVGGWCVCQGKRGGHTQVHIAVVVVVVAHKLVQLTPCVLNMSRVCLANATLNTPFYFNSLKERRVSGPTPVNNEMKLQAVIWLPCLNQWSGRMKLTTKLQDQAAREAFKTRLCGLQFWDVSRWKFDLFMIWTDRKFAKLRFHKEMSN